MNASSPIPSATSQPQGVSVLPASYLGRHRLFSLLAFAITFSTLLPGCKDAPSAPSRYPKEISKILEKRCATSGCHNAESKDAAAGLNLESWDALFEGSRGGSAVVPYSPEQSFLLYSINTDSSLGPVVLPTMPLQDHPLDNIDYQLIRRWIELGAKNRDGEERFPPRADRRKWYIGHYGCDLVAVLDAESKQVMRYIPVGGDSEIREALYDVTVSPDGRFWYASYALHRTVLDKYSTLTDEIVASIPLGHSAWNNLAISPDGKLGFLVSLTRQEIAVLDLQNDVMLGAAQPLTAQSLSPQVHPTLNRVYFPAFSESHLVIFDYDPQGQLSNRREVDLVQSVPNPVAGDLQPLQVAFSPDGSTYFVSCWNSREIRVFDGLTDSLLDAIVLPSGPASLAVSPSSGYLFASCPDDAVSFTGPQQLGSIAVIDLSSHQLLGMRYAGFQPYGLVVDDVSGHLLVAARNELESGPSQHHPSACQGRNGYLTLIDMETLTEVPGYGPELSVDPITLSVKD